jgi:biotin carboxyl carrier protein
MGKKGQKVEKGDTVLIMEAMKMENEIKATFTGEITNIFVNEGQAVESGGLLVEINPA